MKDFYNVIIQKTGYKNNYRFHPQLLKLVRMQLIVNRNITTENIYLK